MNAYHEWEKRHKIDGSRNSNLDRLDKVKKTIPSGNSLTKDDFLNMPSNKKGGYDFLGESDEADMDPILKARKKAKKETPPNPSLVLFGTIVNT